MFLRPSFSFLSGLSLNFINLDRNMLKKDQCWRCDAACSVIAAKINCNNCEVAYYCSDSFRHQVDCQAASSKRKCVVLACVGAVMLHVQ